MFKVYPGSDGIATKKELLESQIVPEEIQLRSDLVLATLGWLWIEAVEYSGGFLMWMGFSTEIVGLHADKSNLEFIAKAYHLDVL